MEICGNVWTQTLDFDVAWPDWHHGTASPSNSSSKICAETDPQSTGTKQVPVSAGELLVTYDAPSPPIVQLLRVNKGNKVLGQEPDNFLLEVQDSFSDYIVRERRPEQADVQQWILPRFSSSEKTHLLKSSTG